MRQGLAWESVSWRNGNDQFTFEIERGGLFATIKAPGNRSFTLPMVVWEGMVDALKANRATKAREDQRFPVRTGSRWYDGEAEELAKAFLAGRSIAALAKAHHRTEYAIENQLDKMGLFSKAEKYGPAGPNAAGHPIEGGADGIGMHPLDAPADRSVGTDDAVSLTAATFGMSSQSPFR